MREQQSFSDGSVDLGQGAISPSAQDIAFFKDRSRISPPLKDTHGRNSSLARTATAASVIFAPSAPKDIFFQAPNGEYCIIEFLPDQGFTYKDYLRFNVGFYEPSNPDSEHRVVIKNEFGQIVNPDNISKYSTSALINGVTLNKRLSNGDYTMEVREKAVDLIFGDEGKSCEVDLYLGTDGGPRDENGNPILPDEQIARIESMQEILSKFIAKYDGKPVEANDRSNLNQCTDLVTAFADELEISREAVTGIGIAKNLYLNPRETTKDFFEMIKYEKGTKIQAGDVMVWDERVGSPAGHMAIATGEMRNGKFVTFSQNYPLVDDPKDATAHLQEIGDEGLIGILRPKGFGPREEAPRATEKPDPKKRIEAILAVEPGDSNEIIGRKTALSAWFNALTSEQQGEDVTLITFILNLEEWEANFQRLLNGETISGNPLKIVFRAKGLDGYYWDDLHVGRGEIDDISLGSDDRSDSISNLSRKNGLEGRVFAVLTSTERSQTFSYRDGMTEEEVGTQFDNLPPMSEWRDNRIEIWVFLENGTWTAGSFRYYLDDTEWMREYGGWKGIQLVSKMFLGW